MYKTILIAIVVAIILSACAPANVPEPVSADYSGYLTYSVDYGNKVFAYVRMCNESAYIYYEVWSLPRDVKKTFAKARPAVSRIDSVNRNTWYIEFRGTVQNVEIRDGSLLKRAIEVESISKIETALTQCPNHSPG